MAHPYLQKSVSRAPLISEEPESELRLVVVIPCYDEPQLQDALDSLWACQPTQGAVEVIVIINASENDTPEVYVRNRKTLQAALVWSEAHRRAGFHCFPILLDPLPARQAGVGLARKIGLDEGCRRLLRVGDAEGILLFFDADSRCDPNYLREVERFFQQNLEKQIVSIYFEHPLAGEAFSQAIYSAIQLYELHLRYFIQVQRWAGFPHAVHTIGSSMAVRASAYMKQGGMNRRQAGEDFYFMHKFTPLGVHAHLNTTRVIPSPRPSHRVPFGTGREVIQQLEEGEGRLTYSPYSFQDLRPLLLAVPQIWNTDLSDHLPKSVRLFLEKENWTQHLQEIRAQVASREAFVKRFFRWFNAFRLMKFAHFARDHFYPDIPVVEAAEWLLHEKGIAEVGSTPLDILLAYRKLDRRAF